MQIRDLSVHCFVLLASAAIACSSGGGGGSGGNGDGGSGGGDGSNGNGSSNVTTSCTQLAGSLVNCALFTGTASAAMAQDSSCKSLMGTIGTSCPTANLSGCCVVSNGTNVAHLCYYGISDTSTPKSICAQSDGQWSTSL
jgi:hypothetical protein